MTWLPCSWVMVLSLAWMLAGCGGGVDSPVASSVKVVAGGEAKPADGYEEAPKQEGLKAISKILASGRVHRGVTYPMFEEGVLKTVLTAEEMVRVSDDELDLVDMVIESFGENREPEYRIDLKTAKYHLATEELTSDEETLVTGRTFTIRGDRMIYRSEGGVARMEGNIVMEINDVKSFSMDESRGTGEGSGSATETKETK